MLPQSVPDFTIEPDAGVGRELEPQIEFEDKHVIVINPDSGADPEHDIDEGRIFVDRRSQPLCEQVQQGRGLVDRRSPGEEIEVDIEYDCIKWHNQHRISEDARLGRGLVDQCSCSPCEEAEPYTGNKYVWFCIAHFVATVGYAVLVYVGVVVPCVYALKLEGSTLLGVVAILVGMCLAGNVISWLVYDG